MAGISTSWPLSLLVEDLQDTTANAGNIKSLVNLPVISEKPESLGTPLIPIGGNRKLGPSKRLISNSV